MNTHRFLIGWLAILTLAIFNLQTASAAPLGTAFTYQGRLVDGGNPATGIYDLRFAIYDAGVSGNPVGGLVTNSATGVTNGLFTVTLDFGEVFDGSSRWLEIAARTNGAASFTTLAPRQALTPTPYAVYSANAGSATTAGSAGSVAAANITGTMALVQLPAAVLTDNASGVSLTGSFSGNGAGVTNVNLIAANSQGAITWFTNWGSFFTLSSSPGVGSSPSSVAAVDVNGDGRVDLISANYGSGTLTVLTNNGSGGLVLSSSPGAGSYPYSVAAADVNGDGWVDLISANVVDSTLTVLTNNGSGGFALSSSPGVGSLPFSVVAADVNGDGWVDLISANRNANTLTVLTNNGSGGFALSSSLGVGSYPESVAAADVNGDGKVDLISANYYGNTLTVLTNNGSGGFVLSSSPGVGNDPYFVATADVNGNGKVDLISANSGGGSGHTLTVLTNNGSGGFVLSSSPGVGNNPWSVTAADVNGDGKVDLISANYSSTTLTVLTNNGSGGFVLSSSPGVGRNPRSVAAADVNGDGKVDLIAANSSDATLSVLFNTPLSYQAGFVGSGAGLTGINATAITNGTLVDARLSANVALLNTNQTFTASNRFSGVVMATNSANAFNGAFTGNGANLTNIGSGSLASNAAALAKVSGGNMAVSNSSVGVGVTPSGSYKLQVNGKTYVSDGIETGQGSSGTGMRFGSAIVSSTGAFVSLAVGDLVWDTHAHTLSFTNKTDTQIHFAGHKDEGSGSIFLSSGYILPTSSTILATLDVNGAYLVVDISERGEGSTLGFVHLYAFSEKDSLIVQYFYHAQ